MNALSTVLIVDDEPLARAALEGLLLSQGYRLAFAGTGPEALIQAVSLMPDVVLLDVMMPGMDGFEVCRRLRADPLTAEMPVILLTALDDRESRLEGLEAGADDFVSKPYDSAELRARVRTITRLNRYRRLLVERANLEWVVEQSIDGHVVVNSRDQILYANPQARRLLCIPAEATEPDLPSFLECATREYRCEPAEAWGTWLDKHIPPFPRYLVRPESAVAKAMWLQIGVLPPRSPSDDRWIVRLHDVSAEMGLQTDMWRFHNLVSHKLRTPLGHLVTSLELLANDGADFSDPTTPELFNLALQGAQRLYHEVEDIFQFLNSPALAAAGSGFELGQLGSLVSQISAQLGLESVVVSAGPGLDRARLSLSPPALESVLWEILQNAQKFHPRQAPHVDILVSSKPDPRGSDNPMACIQIGDDGVSVPPERLERVWRPYYQGEKGFSGEVEGMGLGLARVASIVYGVGGSCQMVAREGTGTIVELMLPLEQGSPERMPSLAAAVIQGNRQEREGHEAGR